MSDQMSEAQFNEIKAELADIKENMVRKSDMFQTALTVQGFTVAIIVGVIVVINSVVGFG